MVLRPDEWKWSSCCGYYGQETYPGGLLDCNLLLMMYSPDIKTAQKQFKVFNESRNDDECLEEKVNNKRLKDEEARINIMQILDRMEIPEVKSLPKEERNVILRKVKGIEGISMRQVARILGISLALVFKA